MSETLVQRNSAATLGRIEGGLRAGANARLIAADGKTITVAGGAYFEGPVTIDCDFECQSMQVDGRGWGPGGDVIVKGDLNVHGSADINASVKVDGEVRAEDFDVAGHLLSGSLISKRLRVGGHLTTKGSLRAETVDVGGHMTVTDEVDLVGLRVGGHAEIGGGKISGEIKARGHFTTTRKLVYGRVQVYGHLRLPAGSSGEYLSALGKVEFAGDTTCKLMEVDGAGSVNGNCTAESVKVNGKFETTGFLHASEKLEVYGAAEAKKFECGTLLVGGRLVASSILATGQADLAGEVRTERGLKGKDVRVGTGSRVNGPIVGETVEIGKGVDLGGFWEHAARLRTMGKLTKVDDVWGGEVRIGRYSQAKRIYGEVIKMQAGSMADEVQYTREADLPQGSRVEKPPKKVDKLPSPPL